MIRTSDTGIAVIDSHVIDNGCSLKMLLLPYFIFSMLCDVRFFPFFYQPKRQAKYPTEEKNCH